MRPGRERPLASEGRGFVLIGGSGNFGQTIITKEIAICAETRAIINGAKVLQLWVFGERLSSHPADTILLTIVGHKLTTRGNFIAVWRFYGNSAKEITNTI